MKKLLMFLCCVFALNVTNGFAECQPTNKCLRGLIHGQLDDILDAEDLETRKDKDNTQEVASCYWCGANKDGSSCVNGDIVVGQVGGKWKARRCYEGFGMSDHWAEYEMKECSPNDNVEKIGSYDAENDLYAAKDTVSETIRQNLPNVTVRAGRTFCIKARSTIDTGNKEVNSNCMSPFVQGRSQTIGFERDNAPCDGLIKIASGVSNTGRKSGNVCNIKCVKEGWDITLMYNACQDGYNLDTTKKRCVSSKPVSGGAKPPVNQPVTPPVNTPVQPATPYVYSCPNIDIDAGNCATAKVAIDELKQYCANDTTRDFNGYNTRVANINNLIAECDKKNNQAAAASLTMRIRQLNTKIAGKLDGWHKDLNVWKTAEGDFNTARLASDSIAGVVLGTAGGLITSHVVKKGQIKNGFEDINCAIGGQNVAGWHDEFTVGIK